jgi:membrane-anchored glycerophosphoryl diester phosphodiesterase (GDPDase)
VIGDAFKLPASLPEPIGVYANQPNPWDETHRRVCRLFWKLALLAVLLQVFFVLVAGGKPLLRQELAFRRNWPAKAW